MPLHNLNEFRKKLISWFENNKRDLPWRRTNDPYPIWVSEVMLQQTQVKKVIDYYDKFIESFPTVSKLSNADLKDVLKKWEGMGYYARARNLHKASSIIKDEFEGRIPDDTDSFRSLPGVGDYITAAVLSRAFHKPLAVVDGNVKRVVARLFMIGEPVNSTKASKLFSSYTSQMIDPEHPGQFNEAMMELGATICTPQNPGCLICPVSKFCKSYINKCQSEYPIKSIKKSVPLRHFVVGLIYRDDKFLVVRRELDSMLGGLWELPGGIFDLNEDIREVCAARITEITGLKIKVEDKIMLVNHAYSHFKINIQVFQCLYMDGHVELSNHIEYDWIKLNEIDKHAFHVAHHKIFRKLKRN